ncbi:MAG: glycosyltransferase family 4 protein [Thermodesulfobacteriota bacterium]
MLKALFVSSGNSKNGISPIVKNQGESLREAGVDVEYYPVHGKGLNGYLKNVLPLKRHNQKNTYDIIHAHYSLSALVATLAGCRPMVVSLMGSDIRLGLLYQQAVKFSSYVRWKALIVKSLDMKDNVRIQSARIIPNGINVELFKPLSRDASLNRLGWDKNKTHILFAANPAREVKNYNLLERAWKLLDNSHQVKIHVLENVPHQDIPIHMSASDLVVLTSLWEGSPNVVKEAMACNCPVVATDVGDISWLFGNEPGHFLCGFDPENVAHKLSLALEFADKHGRTRGRERILELGLDSESVAKRIVEVYEEVARRA